MRISIAARVVFAHVGMGFVAAFVWVTPAYAYLDPATGSIILQGLIAGIAGLAVVLRLYWARVKGFFRRLGGGEEKVEAERVELPSSDKT